MGWCKCAVHHPSLGLLLTIEQFFTVWMQEAFEITMRLFSQAPFPDLRQVTDAIATTGGSTVHEMFATDRFWQRDWSSSVIDWDALNCVIPQIDALFKECFLTDDFSITTFHSHHQNYNRRCRSYLARCIKVLAKVDDHSTNGCQPAARLSYLGFFRELKGEVPMALLTPTMVNVSRKSLESVKDGLREVNVTPAPTSLGPLTQDAAFRFASGSTP
jgi:hypothetical protein